MSQGFSAARERHSPSGASEAPRRGSVPDRAGELDSTLFAIEDGHLEVIGIDDGEQRVFATVGPGDVLGEVAFIDDSPRTTSVRATDEETIVRAWDKRTLSEALAFEPQLLAKFAVAMSELLVERLRDVSRRV